ncbi:hypothetical protein WJX84_006538 [Apatococcus fuscideae]|uniref:Uncharacterized protein n=1 Tax=Apatococcus fuscideae TaxID=2026836 RepID=A0AAW1TE76_9CHLO
MMANEASTLDGPRLSHGPGRRFEFAAKAQPFREKDRSPDCLLAASPHPGKHFRKREYLRTHRARPHRTQRNRPDCARAKSAETAVTELFFLFQEGGR